MSRSASNCNKNNNTSSMAQLATKLCHVIKRPDFEGYGFNLHSEKIKPGQYIGKVDANSPAEAAGLKEGDRIIEVNGVNISQESHKQVVQRIKAIANEVRLLIVDVDAGKNGNAPNTCHSNNNTTKSNKGNNNNLKESEGIVQEIPGSSTNISSISMISTKRSSNINQYVNQQCENNGKDVIDNSSNVSINEHNGSIPNNMNEKMLQHEQQQQSANIATSMIIQSTTADNLPNITTATPNESTANTTVSSPNIAETSKPSVVTRPSCGGLELPLTAAEMRAKLLSKKKYDPKKDSVDMKKKFEIIQKL